MPANQLWCIQQLDEPEEIIGILWLSLTGSSAWISDLFWFIKLLNTPQLISWSRNAFS
jgi:hypothetical protein